MTYKFIINQKLPSFNDYIKACRTNKYVGAKMKEKVEQEIWYYIISQLKNIKIKKPIIIHFTWIEENKRRDLDNIAFAKKFILDALQKAGVLENDNQKYVKGFTDKFLYEKQARVIIEMEEIENGDY